MCEHMEFEASVKVARLLQGPDKTFIGNLAVDVTAYCIRCEQPVLFEGLFVGVDLKKPMVSADLREARLPAYVGA